MKDGLSLSSYSSWGGSPGGEMIFAAEGQPAGSGRGHSVVLSGGKAGEGPPGPRWTQIYLEDGSELNHSEREVSTNQSAARA